MVFQHRRDEMILDIGCWQAWVRTPEPARLGKAGCHDASALAAMFDDSLNHLGRASERIAEEIIFGFGFEAGNIIDMVLQVGTNRGLVMDNVHANTAQMFGRPHAR